MQIDKIGIVLRPRSTWESFDLGFVITRKWWGRLFVAWAMLAVPVFAIASLAAYQRPWLALLIFWWAKPLYEQLPLYYISRAIFGELPGNGELAKRMPAVALKQLLANLTWRRLSLNRSFTAPLAQLEGLAGGKRRARIKALSDSVNAGAWLTITCVYLELVLNVSVILMAVMLIPFELDMLELLDHNDLQVAFMFNISYFFAAAIMAPFYVVSGFSLYLNRRTHLEGWDIELAFRRLQQRFGVTKVPRVAAVIMVLFMAGVVNMSTVGDSRADSQAQVTDRSTEVTLIDPASAKDLITEVLAADDFGELKKSTQWQLKEQFRRDPKPDADDLDLGVFERLIRFITSISYYLFWLLAALFVLALLYYLPKWRGALGNTGGNAATSAAKPPNVLFGLDISSASLPEDIPGETWRLYQEGEKRAAISLLYRGSLSALVNNYGLMLRESDTEGQCAGKVTGNLSHLSEYYGRLTRVWVDMAYGHIEPSPAAMQFLCENWHTRFFQDRS